MIKPYTPLLLALGATSFCSQADSFSDQLSVSQWVAFANNYVSRGVSGSSNEAVVQGCIDIAHDSGAYVGLWGSSGDQGGEIDWWAGYTLPLGSDYGLNVQLTRFYYPGATNHQTEGSVTLITPWVEISARHDWDYGHNYYELNKALPLADQWQLLLHAGYKNYGEKKYQPDHWAYDKAYADAAVKVAYDLTKQHRLFAGYSWHQDNDRSHATDGKVLFGIIASF